MRITACFNTVLLSLLTFSTAISDDIEIYVGQGGAGVNPNVLFVFDTSASMDADVEISTYDSSITYSVPAGEASCVPDSNNPRIYVGGINTSHPECDSPYWFKKSKFHCEDASDALDLDGEGIGSGFYFDKIARWNDNFNNWYSLHSSFYQYRTESIYYECEDDFNEHGKFGGDPSKDRILNGYDCCPWWSSGSSNVYNSISSRTLFTPNYLHWFHYHGGETGSVKTRLEIVVDAARDLLSSVSDLNVGIMRFDSGNPQTGGPYTDVNHQFDTHGGPVVYPISDINDDEVVEDLIGDGTPGNQGVLGTLTAVSSTPLVETVWEGLQYYQGGDVQFGLPPSGGEIASHSGSRTGNSYDTPISYDCGKNYMIVFTDGAPTADHERDSQINAKVSGAPGALGSCNHGANRYFALDSCLDELSYYMFQDDHATEAQGNDLPGKQNIVSYYIGGFEAADDQLLDDAAAAGGTTQSFSASNPSEFASVFGTIVSEILEANAAFTSPAVSVNALNRLKHNNDLYFALFEPAETPHWNGNLKKYRLQSSGTDSDGDGEDDLFIGDSNGNNAVNPTTGLFEENSLSFWALNSSPPDGDQTASGGAAHRMFDYSESLGYNAPSRQTKVFTYLTNYLPDDANFDGNGIDLIQIHENNADETLTEEDPNFITKSALGLSSSFDDDEFFKRVKWMRGVDVKDENFNGNSTEGRPVMGGVLHTEPVLVNYEINDNGTPLIPGDDTQTNVIIATSNDGYLHIFKTEGSSPSDKSRLEHSAVVPKSALGRMDELYVNDTGNIAYRLDSNIDIWRHESPNDADDDITTGGDDHVYAYFGQRRGGNIIHAMDITDPGAPKLLWEINPQNVPAGSTDAGIGPFNYMGQSWSKPRHHKILTKKSGVDALEIRDIVIFGGGYDFESDDAADSTRNSDTLGNTIFIVDARTGELLWWAGKTGLSNVTPDFTNADMKYGFTADIRIVDINGDDIADKIFATDAGGQVWRFDINNFLSAGENLALAARISGGVIADLQLSSEGATETNSNNRRLYYPPDVSIVQIDDSTDPFLAIAVGTGYRAHPLNKTIDDRFYVLKYEDIIEIPSDYEAIKVYTDDLLDVSNLNFADDPPPTISETDSEKLQNKGWYIDLPDDGEKSLSESITAAGTVIFTTYTPPSSSNPQSGEQSCNGNQGAGKVYAVSIVNGSPVENLDGVGLASELELSDRSFDLKVSGIPPRPKVVFPDLDEISGKIIVGRELLPVNIPNIPELTYWVQRNVR